MKLGRRRVRPGKYRTGTGTGARAARMGGQSRPPPAPQPCPALQPISGPSQRTRPPAQLVCPCARLRGAHRLFGCGRLSTWPDSASIVPTNMPPIETPHPRTAAAVPRAHGLPGASSSLRAPAALSFPRLLTVAGIYWLYVTVSYISYAHSLRVGFGQTTTVSRFSRGMRVCSSTWRCSRPWSDACGLGPRSRVAADLAGRAAPQLLLAACFAVAAAPALWVGERLFSYRSMSTRRRTPWTTIQ